MKWIDVNERRPANNEMVIIYRQYSYGDKKVSTGMYSIDPVITRAVLSKNGQPVWYDYRIMEYIHDGQVTHWMPLPDAPESSE